ncbi:MAG: radical SAM protein [Spirochaetales bacterium]|nr:radical SAM protein [Spirochaetales bacterium]
MKAAVVVPPLRDFYMTRHRFSILGAKTVTAILQKNNIEPVLFNFPVMRNKPAVIPLPLDLSYLERFIIPNETGKASFFTSYKHFGPSFENAARIVASSRPDILFLCCFAFCYAGDLLETAAALKNIIPRVPVTAGGNGVSVYPHYFLEHPCIDYVLTGEAEVSLAAFIHAIEHKTGMRHVPNLYRKEGNRIVAPPLQGKSSGDDLLCIFNKTHETENSLFFSTAVTRGCTKKCRFCVHYHETTLRTVPYKKILKESEKAFDTECREKEIALNFEDDNLLLRSSYFLRLLRGLASPRRKTSFYIESGIDYTLLTPFLVNTLVAHGLSRFNLSLASTDPECCEAEGRSLDLPRYETIIGVLNGLDIPSVTYFICGLENDTKESVAESLLYLARQPTVCGISLFYPVPGLPGFENMNRFMTRSPALTAGSSAYPWNGSLSTSTLITAFRLSRYINAAKALVRTDIERELLLRIAGKKRLHTIVNDKKKKRIVEVPEMDTELENIFFSRLATL